jgi:hypothetical protein
MNGNSLVRMFRHLLHFIHFIFSYSLYPEKPSRQFKNAATPGPSFFGDAPADLLFSIFKRSGLPMKRMKISLGVMLALRHSIRIARAQKAHRSLDNAERQLHQSWPHRTVEASRISGTQRICEAPQPHRVCRRETCKSRNDSLRRQFQAQYAHPLPAGFSRIQLLPRSSGNKQIWLPSKKRFQEYPAKHLWQDGPGDELYRKTCGSAGNRE